MRRKHEVIDGARISCWDSGPEWADRYTVVYLDEACDGTVPCVGMSAQPFHPQGVGMHSEMPLRHVQYISRGGCFKRRIKFTELPADCQKLVKRDIADTKERIRQRLEYLRGEIEAERISYGEIAELQELIPYIDPGDVLLLQWAGVKEG